MRRNLERLRAHTPSSRPLELSGATSTLTVLWQAIFGDVLIGPDGQMQAFPSVSRAFKKNKNRVTPCSTSRTSQPAVPEEAESAGGGPSATVEPTDVEMLK